MRIPTLALSLCALGACIALPSQAAFYSGVDFYSAGSEWKPDDFEAPWVSVNETPIFGEVNGSVGAVCDDFCYEVFQYTSWTSRVIAKPLAEVTGTSLKVRSGLEGAIAPVITSNIVVMTEPNGNKYLSGTLAGANWDSFAFYSGAYAGLDDEVIITHPTAEVGSFRMVFNVDGDYTEYIDTFNPAMSGLGWTGGGYEVADYSMTLDLKFGTGGTADTNIHHWDYSVTPQDPFNYRKVYDQVVVSPQTVMSGSVAINNGVAQSIDLMLASETEIRMRNLDSGSVLFKLVADFTNTVDLLGFAVYDVNGNLLPDAVVTGKSGTYTTLDALPGSSVAIPEPGTVWLLLAGLGLLGFAARRKQAV
jgi:hypothetical protein